MTLTNSDTESGPRTCLSVNGYQMDNIKFSYSTCNDNNKASVIQTVPFMKSAEYMLSQTDAEATRVARYVGQ